MSYSELRCIHEVRDSHKREVLAGSTNMLTPQSFLMGLKQMTYKEEVALV